MVVRNRDVSLAVEVGKKSERKIRGYFALNPLRCAY